MATDTPTKSPEAAAVPPPRRASGTGRDRQGHKRLLTRRDRITLGLMAGVPTVLHVALVWVTAIASIFLAFTTWDGIGFDSIKWVGLQNFTQLFDDNPQFWPAVQHNVIWFVVLILVPTPFGLFLAVQLDKRSASAGSTRRRSSCPWSSPWPASASSGSSSTTPTPG